MALVEAFDEPIHPQEVRKRLHDLEQRVTDLEALCADEQQRRRLLESTILLLAERLRPLLGLQDSPAHTPPADETPVTATGTACP